MSSLGKTGRPGQAARAGTTLRRAYIRLARATMFLTASVRTYESARFRLGYEVFNIGFENAFGSRARTCGGVVEH